MRCKIFLIFLGLILFANLLYAGFQISDKSIETQYGVSENLVAQITISFDNESLYSNFNDSIGNSITLLELLNKNTDFNASVNETFNTVSSDAQVLYFIYANFSMPSTPVNISYKLNFTNETIFSEDIEIISVYSSVDKALDDKSEEITNFKLELKKFDLFTQAGLNEIFNVSGFENELEEARKKYENASSEEYDEILQDISGIQIPLSLSESTVADSINFFPERKNVNLDLLKSIGGGDYELDKEEEYVDAVFAWNQKNLETKVTFNEISAIYSGKQEIVLRTFKFVFDKSNLQVDTYFIIEELDEFKFEKDYGEQQESGYYYINIYDAENIILFSTTEEVNFVDVPTFIAPSLNNLDLVELEEYIDTQKENKYAKWMLFVLIMILLILAGIVVYVILQVWYKRKYENYLFKNRNNLFNIINYINNAKKKGMKRDEIAQKLKKAKWTSEQINYALKKYAGKRTGMAELPFTKFLKTDEKKNLKK